MYFSQMLFAFRGVRKYSGKTLPELCEAIRSEWGEYEAVRWMTFDGKTDQLKKLLNDLSCVELRDGKYFFNPEAKELFRVRDKSDALAAPLEYLLRKDMENFPINPPVVKDIVT